jgi:Spy/CpxP family protein refolding chaperone
MTGQTRRRWFGVFMGLVYCAGIGTGILLRQYLESSPTASEMRPGFPGPPPPGMMANVLAKQLDLSDTQRAQVETILSARRQKLGSLGEQIRTRMESDRADLFAEIDRILTPEQRPKLEALAARLREQEQLARERLFSPKHPPEPPTR